MREFAEDSFKCDENGRKFAKQVENTGKRRNCLLRAITSFSYSVFKRILLQTLKNMSWFVKGLTHYQTTNFRLFQTEEFADNNFKFDKNGRKLSKRVENTVGKEEIARYEQFLLFPQCFQKACFQEESKVSLCGNGLNQS